ncbi:hypothetical protein SDJN03_20336, partial [Cucurbita argyrosperma subsp. sororia]
MAKASSSFFQTLKRYIKKPWEITGPCADPEYKLAVPSAIEYRVFCPATTKEKAIVPTSNPETVFDIKYYTRDQRRNRPPIRRTILKKPDVEKMMKETKSSMVRCALGNVLSSLYSSTLPVFVNLRVGFLDIVVCTPSLYLKTRHGIWRQ